MNSIAGIDIIFCQANSDFSKRWLEFNPSTKVLPKGWVKAPGRRPLPEDIIFEKDIPISLRDGTVIRVDVFRPPSSSQEPVPALLAWSPYGKEGNGELLPVLKVDVLSIPIGFQSLDVVPFRAGVPTSWTSDLEKFEAPDPAEWCPRGYAIVNIDPRGVGDSEGDIYTLGTQVSQHGAVTTSISQEFSLQDCRRVETVTIQSSILLHSPGVMVLLPS